LFTPMLEAYFFGEADALRRAGSKKEPRFDAMRDIEDFETLDDEYLASCARQQQVDREMRGPNPVPPWAQNAAKHPKRYLQFLCDPTGRDPRAYRETTGGCEALRLLDWNSILTRREHVQFGRAFLVDLARGLGRDDLVQRWQGQTHPLTSH